MPNSASVIRASLLRAGEAFSRRPSAALQEDSPATAVWTGGLSTRLLPPGRQQFGTDMPAVLGGDGEAPPPGWFFRAGVASCLATTIAMEACLRGVALARLEVKACSESDARGMLGVASVPAGPVRCWLIVKVEAEGATHESLREMVESAHSRAPMASALRAAIDVPFELHVDASART